MRDDGNPRPPLPARRGSLPVHRVRGEVLPPPQRYETIHEWGEPLPYVSHPAPPTRRGWVTGLGVALVIVGVILMLSSLPEIVGWL